MADPTSTEIELKLLLSGQDRAALEGDAALRSPACTAPELREERTTYFDTPELDLARRGLSLRVRRSGETRIQTLKSQRRGHRGVATPRGEWEWPVDGEAPDLSRIAATPFGHEITQDVARRLRPVFATDVRRTVRNMKLSGGTRAELAFDEGVVSAGEAAQPISELELELKEGAPGALYRLALDLHRVAPFTLGAQSKAERGLRLLTGEAPTATQAERPALDRHDTALGAASRLIGAELGHLLSNQPAAASGDVEGIHQVRVGIRKLRTVLALFGKHLEPLATARFETELQRLGHVFGAARDWDVFCTQVLDAAEQDERATPWVEQLRAPAEEQRRAAHAAAEAELHAPALTALVLGMAAWTEPDDAGHVAMAAGKLERRLAKLAPGLLDRMARRVEKVGGSLQDREPEELHRLRKRLKKLRYSADYLADLYPHKSVTAYTKPAKRALKLLGDGNDATVAAALAARVCDGRPELAAAGSALSEWSMRCRTKAHRKLAKAWAKFERAPPFWR